MTYNFHSSCKHMHLSFKSVCFGKNYSSVLDLTRNYEQTSGIFVPCTCIWGYVVQTCIGTILLAFLYRLEVQHFKFINHTIYKDILLTKGYVH